MDSESELNDAFFVKVVKVRDHESREITRRHVGMLGSKSQMCQSQQLSGNANREGRMY